MDAGRLVGGEHVTVAVVFVLVAPRVLPVIEDLAAQDVPADTPCVFPAVLAQNALPHADGIGVDHFKGTVAVDRREALGECQRVVIGRRSAQVKPHECHRRRAIGQHLHIAGNEAEVLRVPGARGLVVGHFQHDVAQADDLLRPGLNALRVIHTNNAVGRVERHGRTMRQRAAGRLAPHGIHAKTGRVTQAHAQSAARCSDWLHARCARQAGERFQVFAVGNTQTESDKAVCVCLVHHVTERGCTGAAHEQPLAVAPHGVQAEVGQELLCLGQVRPFED